MRRGRILIYIGLILILGLVGAVLILQRLNQPAPSNGTPTVQDPQTPTTNVVITTQRVSRGDEISEGVVQLVAIPQDRVIDGMFTELEQVVGAGLVARFDLEPGIFLTRAMVADFSDLGPSGSDAALLIDPGMVAVSIPINRLSSVAYGLRRGDYVNVIVTLLFVDIDTTTQSILPNNTSSVLAPGPAVVTSITEESADASSAETTIISDELLQTLTAQVVSGGVVSPVGRLELDPTLGQPFYIVPSEPQRPRAVSQTLIQHAMVLNMGTFSLEDPGAEPTPTPDPAAAPDQQADGEPTPVPAIERPDIITLVVTPQDAVTLNYLVMNGAYLSLAMRGANDDSRAETEAVTLQFLLDQYNIQNPAKLPYGLEPRIDDLIPPSLPNDQQPQPQP